MVLAVAAATATVAGEPIEVSRLAWLQGCWVGDEDGIAMEEHWTSPAGDGLVGMHKDVKAGRMISFEFLRVVRTANQGVCYLSSPNGRPVTTFCAIEMSDRRVVFENKEHDFPQRVLYWLDDEGRLHARIEGSEGGKAAFEEWVWKKSPGAPCPG
jgi:hypothetical protein